MCFIIYVYISHIPNMLGYNSFASTTIVCAEPLVNIYNNIKYEGT